jgi:F420-dependent oxidoreductase-like protein
MDVGVIVPQGWTGEYDGWEPRRAWARTVEVARLAESLGFESVWLFDHFHTVPEPTDEITFESFTTLTALAMATERVRLGHVVVCTAFRNPALTAKMMSTMDVISGGRMELGIGAGWKRDEWLAYGYGYPDTKDRLGRLKDDLEVISRMFAPGRAAYEGRYSSIEGAVNEPKPLQQPRVPIMVGGNGREVTWRLAARYADELNLDNLSLDEMPEAMKVIRSRCEEIGRDPATLTVSVHIWKAALGREGDERVRLLEGYREAGVRRVMGLLHDVAEADEPLHRLREDALKAGAEIGEPVAA